LLEHTSEWEYRFSFDESYLSISKERPVLGQLFEDRKPFDIATTGHVPIWFSHLLPQARLRRAIAQQLGVDEDDEFDLLQFLGSDLPGAVRLGVGQPRLSHEPPPLPTPNPIDTQNLRVALAGMQWKLSVRPGDRGWTVPVQGETGSYIAKFYDPTFKDLPRVEFATTLWARAAQIPLPDFRQAHISEFAALPTAIPTGDGTVFLTQRFDRVPSGGRVHIEDFAQVLDRPPGTSQYGGRYEHLSTFLGSTTPEDVRPFCERLVFCILCGNTDAHLKNWSIIYPDGHTPRLSPAYDLVSSVIYAPHEITDDLALSIGESRLFEDVRLDSFQLLAQTSGYSFDEVASWVSIMAQRVRDAWQQEASHLPLQVSERKRIEEHLARVPLANGG
ncbi:type II toxin-antitoxin system HipA family toxin, partial [Myxococcus vastator]|uniref:type II toxin-antitoxin system HipA family toxin n=1 Tax=Myxococcus vastator TaxID=2709664 RepID=UPI0013D2A437